MAYIVFEASTCWKCEEPMRFQAGRIEHAQKSNTPLYCPFGHANYWQVGKTDAEKLQDELEAERRRRQSAEQNIAYWQDEAKREKRRANGYKAHATKITKRAKAGVCPCCNRHFTALERHMASKHPDFTPLEVEQAA
jgi:hypothetical protein